MEHTSRWTVGRDSAHQVDPELTRRSAVSSDRDRDSDTAGSGRRVRPSKALPMFTGAPNKVRGTMA